MFLLPACKAEVGVNPFYCYFFRDCGEGGFLGCVLDLEPSMCGVRLPTWAWVAVEHVFRCSLMAFHTCCFCPPGLDVCSPLCLRHLPRVLITPPSLCIYLLSERGTSQVPAAPDCSPKFSTKYFFHVASFFSFQFPSLNPETLQSVSS